MKFKLHFDTPFCIWQNIPWLFIIFSFKHYLFNRNFLYLFRVDKHYNFINYDKYVILPYFWVPEETLDLRVRLDHVPYDVWERQGYLQTTEGNVVHYGYIEKFIERLEIDSISEKLSLTAGVLCRWCKTLRTWDSLLFPFGQGFKDMSPPTKELMKLTLEEKLAHGGHPVLRWMMDNIYIRTDLAGNIKADKEKSTEKIDGAIATIMGLDRAIRCGNDAGASVYDNRGILFI
jgi:phage terminase large subunit-like protein